MQLNVMTFNLRVNTPFDRANAWPHRIRRVASLVGEIGPMLFGTQEAFYEMLRDLDAVLPSYKRVGEGRAGYECGDSDLDECCAIFYRDDCLTLVKHGQFMLSATPDEPSSNSWDSSEPRICTWGCFASVARPDKRFYVYNTHFDHLGQTAREESAKLLLSRIEACREAEGLPVILMGDFNAEPDNPAIAILRTHLTDAYSMLPEPVGCTYHAFEGGTAGEPIDYVFVTHDVHVDRTIVHRQQVDGGYPSDHYPVEASMEI